MESLIVFGICGVFDLLIEEIFIIILRSVIRDEGILFYYLEVSFEIVVNINLIFLFCG